MIYFDNASTTLQKPPSVAKAVANAINTIANPSRGAYPNSLDGLRLLDSARTEFSEYFNHKDDMRLTFTMNATHALNIAIFSIEGHILSTTSEHNSVLRPLYYRADYSLIESDEKGIIDLNKLEDKIKKIQPKALVISHASNLSGNVLDLNELGYLSDKYNMLLVIDAAQSAGLLDIDMQKNKIDALCFTGHKSLYGPQGTGGIAVSEKFNAKSLMHGGSGNQSFSKTHPYSFPEILEAGTQNAHGIAGLLEGLRYIRSLDGQCYEKSNEITKYFFDKLSKNDKIVFYGDLDAKIRAPLVSLNHKDFDSSELAFILAEENIAVRAGSHCAPLLHKTFGTDETGSLRFSFSHFNSKDEVDIVVNLINSL